MPGPTSTGRGRPGKPQLPPQTPAQASDDAFESEDDNQEITDAASGDKAVSAAYASDVDEAPAGAPTGRSFISSLAADHLDARRGRGRPKKTQDVSGAYGTSDASGEPLDPNSDFVTLENGDGEEPEEPAPVRAKVRGRPKKSDAAAGSTSTSKPKTKAVTAGAAGQSRDRGRPRKSDAAAAAAPAKSSSANPKSAPAAIIDKRGRGRPRKSDVVNQEVDSDAEPAEAVKRGRGRPRKSHVVDGGEDSDAEPAEAFKRGRGRPPKFDALEDPAAEESQPAEPVKRGRGRPSKSSTTPVKAASSTTSKPRGRPPKAGGPKNPVPIGRGRGRPRKSLDSTSSDSSMSDMDADCPAEDDSAILSLPPELLSRVFVYLGAGARPDVSACRLVCRSFHELSSPFLLTTVVFAKRLATIKRLRGVLDHPYFCKHITTLIWDASKYEGRVAEDWNEYVDRCSRAPRNFLDRDWNLTRGEDACILRNLDSIGRPGVLVDDDAAESTGDVFGVQDLAEVSAVSGASESEEAGSSSTSSDPSEDSSMESSDDEGFPVSLDGESSDEDDDSDDVSDSDSAELMDEEVVLFDRDNMVSYQDRVYRMGCHRGLPDYYRLWVNGDRIKTAALPVRILTEVIQKLPKLRHFAFTDYRGLVQSGETYGGLCYRLFGNTLEPTTLGPGRSTPWNELTEALNVFAGLKRRFSSLSIGDQPFQQYVMHPPHLCQLSVGPGMHKWLAKQKKASSRSPFFRLLKDIRSLCLPISMDCMVDDEDSARYVSDTAPFVDALSSGASSLLELRLVMTGALSYEDHITPTTKARSATDHDGTVIEADGDQVTAQRLFHPMATHLRFARLQTLELRGWEFTLLDLQNFLAPHANTLRDLHIIDCLCADSYSAFATAAASWSSNLQLAGIEIFALRFSHFDKATDPQWVRRHEYDDKALHMAGLHGGGMRSPWTPQLTLQEEPFGRPELEAIVMGERSNAVVRRAKTMATVPDGKWWETPVQL